MADGYDTLYMMPVGELGIIGMRGTEELSASVDQYIHGWRRDMTSGPQSLSNGYLRDSYLIDTDIGFSYELAAAWQLMGKWEWEYNSNPGGGTKSSDFRYILGLGYKW